MHFGYAAVWICVLFFMVADTIGAVKELQSNLVFGREYINLKDYANRRNLQFLYDSKNNTAILKSQWSKLEFTVDSKQCVVNGITVWLSFPIAKQNNELFISPIDVKTAIDPILQPPKYLLREKIRVICIDAGHGGKDPGNIEGNHVEKDYTLMFAYEVKRQLENAGLKVFMTRNKDTFIELSERPLIARKQGAQIFISIHFNSTTTRSVKGIETYCMTPADAESTNTRGNNSAKNNMPGNKNDAKNMLLAWNIQKSLVKTATTEDRGIKRARFAVLKEATMPAVLVECGFMSNAEDMQKIQDVAWRRQISKGIVEGILNYKKQIER